MNLLPKKNSTIINIGENIAYIEKELASDTDIIRRSDAIEAYNDNLETSEAGTMLDDEKYLQALQSIPAVEPCKDAISREWMLNELEAHAYDIIYDINSHEKGMSLTGIKQVIDSAPSATVEPNLILPERVERGEVYDVGETITVMNHEDYMDMMCKAMMWDEYGVEPKQGEWIEKESNHVEKVYICSNCNNYEAWGEPEKSPYCPNCGARMKGADGE